MPRSILAQLVVALRDDASRNTKALAGNLKGLGDNASAFASKLNGAKWGAAFERDARRVRVSAQEMGAALGTNSLGWGDKFSKELLKLKLAPREFARVKESYLDLQRALNAPGTRRHAATVLDAQRAWRNQITADLHIARAERARLKEEAARPLGIARKGLRWGAAAAGIYGGAHVGGRAIRGTATAAGIAQREEARDYLGGLNAEQTARLQASSRSMSGRFKSIDASTMHSLLRESALSMGDVGKAIEIAEPLARSLVTLQSLKGKDSALGQLTGFIRALDTLGKNQDPKQVAALIDGATKAAGVQGAEYNPADLWTTAKTAKSAGFSLNETFLSEILPSLIADMGPSRPGTALGSGVAQLIGGRSTKAARSYQTKLGLRDKSGKFLTRDLFASNPYEWANTVLEPALKQSGIDTTNDAAVVEAINKAFSNQTVADVYGRMITQRDQIEKTRKALNTAPGLKAADELPKRDPFVAAEGVTSQLKNVADALVDPIVPSAIDALNGFSGVLARITSSLRENPEIGKQASTIAGGAAAGAGIVGSARAAMALWGGGGISGAIGGGLRGALRGGLIGGALGGIGSFILTPLMALRDAGEVKRPVTPMRQRMEQEVPPDAWERSRRVKEEFGRDKEGFYGRAFMRGADPAPESGQAAGSSFGAAIVTGIASQAPAIAAQGKSLLDMLKAALSGGVDVPVRLTGKDIVGNIKAGRAPGDIGPTDPAAPARASGGSVAAGNLYQVNEFGKELFVPGEDGTIVDPRRFKAGSGGGGKSANITINAPVTINGVKDGMDAVDRVVAEIERRIQDAARAAFADIGVEIA